MGQHSGAESDPAAKDGEESKPTCPQDFNSVNAGERCLKFSAQSGHFGWQRMLLLCSLVCTELQTSMFQMLHASTLAWSKAFSSNSLEWTHSRNRRGVFSVAPKYSSNNLSPGRGKNMPRKTNAREYRTHVLLEINWNISTFYLFPEKINLTQNQFIPLIHKN